MAMAVKSNSKYPLHDVPNVEVLIRAYRREKEARKEAEMVIEQKSTELFYVNKELEQLNVSLEKKIIERTKELESERRKAEESVLAKERFLANTSHEIRTPMNAIVGFTKLLLKGNLPSQQKVYLDAIKASSDNLLVIINDILDFSKIEAGKLDLDFIDFHLREEIETLLYSFEEKAFENHVKLSCQIDSKIHPYINSDPVRLKQILGNLLSNAVKFTHDGSVTLSCTLKDSRKKRQLLEFKVSDTGTGIKKSNQGKIFGSFSQEDQSITRKFGGTGLGLAICKKLTELLHGKIEVASKPGKGTVFTVTIPVNIVNKNANKMKADLKEEMKNTFLEDIDILLVEDNEFNQILVESILAESNVRLRIANNGLQAIEQLQNGAFDVILMDVQMPEMGGIEATKIIRNDLKILTPIIALTANALQKDRERYIKAGMDDYISKPFSEEDLFEKINALMKHKANDKICDLENVYAVAKGDPIAIDHLLEKLVTNIEKLLVQATDAIENNDLSACKFAVHTMKTSMKLIKASSMLDLIQTIEKMNQFDSRTISVLSFKLSSNGKAIIDILKKNKKDCRTEKTVPI